MAKSEILNKNASAPAHPHTPKPRRSPLKAIAAAIAVIAFCAGVYFTPGTSDAFTLATTHQPEPLTELFFTTPQSLNRTPSTNTPVTIAFTIHNLEGKTMTYPYEISIDGATVLSETTPAITNQATLPVRQTLTFKSTNPRVEIAVKLLNTNQSIHYWTGAQP